MASQAPEKPAASGSPSAQAKEDTSADKYLPPLNIRQIMDLIPHRYPFLLVDAVIEHVYGKRIKGYKNLTMNEPFFQVHFPGHPIMPGVLQLEAMAQLGGILIRHLPGTENKLFVFAGIDNARFRRIVVPGDRLDLECELTKFRGPIGKSICRASVNGELASEAELLFSIIDIPE